MILGLSGGVDSSVAAALIHRAIGDQLTCVFVDNGLLRLNEAEQVMETFAQQPRRQGRSTSMPARVPGARSPASPIPSRSARSSAACSSTCSSARRRSSPNAKWLAQGTIYPDVIESAGAQDQEGAHHQVAPQRRRPARDAAPEAAGAAARAVQGRGARARARARACRARWCIRHPFPGPGPGRAHPGRSEARVRRPAAPRRRDLHRGAAQRTTRRRAGTTRPRRPSPCSCRCARSA